MQEHCLPLARLTSLRLIIDNPAVFDFSILRQFVSLTELAVEMSSYRINVTRQILPFVSLQDVLVQSGMLSRLVRLNITGDEAHRVWDRDFVRHCLANSSLQYLSDSLLCSNLVPHYILNAVLRERLSRGPLWVVRDKRRARDGQLVCCNQVRAFSAIDLVVCCWFTCCRPVWPCL